MPQFTCTCGALLDAPDELVGQQARCFACGTLLVVPASAPPMVPVLQAATSQDPGTRVFEYAKGSVFGVILEDGEGSGFLIDDSGMVATNAHVVGRSRRADLAMVDGTCVTAEVVHANADLDLAFVQASTALLGGCRPLRLACEGPPPTGAPVFAIGNPRGFGHTFSGGMVSAGRRKVDGREFVQTDTPLNPGNSGGPLLDASGCVVGVASMIYAGSDGLGFAIPADVLLAEYQRVMEQLSGRPGGAYCNVCGNHSSDIVYCDNCGTRIELDPVVPAPGSDELPRSTASGVEVVVDRVHEMVQAARGRQCGACGAAVPGGEQYCPRCGSSA